MEKPRFKSMYHPEILPGEGVILRAEERYAVIKGALPARLVPLIDGKKTVSEIAAALNSEFSDVEVFYALQRLERDGYLIESISAEYTAVDRYWAGLGVDLEVAGSWLMQNTVGISFDGIDDPAFFVEAFRRNGLQVADDGIFRIVVTDDYLNPQLETRAVAYRDSARTWLPVKPDGYRIWIGPLFRPGGVACYSCLSQRIRLHREADRLIRTRLGREPGPIPATGLASTRNIAVSVVAVEIQRWLVGLSSRLETSVLTYDTRRHRVREHPFTPDPECPLCGTPPVRIRSVAISPDLRSQKKQFTADGDQRTVPPETTFRRFRLHISPITGIVPYLRPVRRRNDQRVTYAAGPPVGMPCLQLDDLYNYQRSFHSGKGMTRAQARASGLCEALERYSGVFRGNESRVTATFSALGNRGIHPGDCLLFSVRQYAERNQTDQPVHEPVPEPFDADRPIEWTPVWSMTHRTTRYIPTAYAFYGYPDHTYCRADSNGSGAGNVLEEAILHGFLELVERDSVAIWWYNQLRRPAVDLHSFDDPYPIRLAEFYRTHLQRDLWVLDVTADTGIPVFTAVSTRRDGNPDDPYMGFGCHLDPGIALRRALTELNQVLPERADRPVRENKLYPVLHPVARQWFDTANQTNQPYLVPDEALSGTTPACFSVPASDDLLDDIRYCESVTRRLGLEMLVLDQTRRDVGLRVVKVIVPGLRHFWKRLAPGRLYDIPVQMGWLPHPYSEIHLNPFPMFL